MLTNQTYKKITLKKLIFTSIQQVTLKIMKSLTTLSALILALAMNGQTKTDNSILFEANTRPLSMLQGHVSVGLEFQVSENTSVLFDGGYGFFSNSGDATSISAVKGGVRRYLSKNDMSGNYVTFSHLAVSISPLVSESYFFTETSFMYGKKIILIDTRVTVAAEVGVGIIRNRELPEPPTTGVSPTLSVTVGYRNH